MKYDPGKAYLYPVLRPGGVDRDYPRAEFESELTVERIKGATAVKASATFELSEPKLLALVKEGSAGYVLLVRAVASHHRSAHRSFEPSITSQFRDGELSGRTEVRGLLVAFRNIPGFHTDGWHSDYGGHSFDISAGSVLAEDEPKDYWIDNAEEAAIGSIFEVAEDKGISNGRWRCALHTQKVRLQMSSDDYRRFGIVRKRVNGMPEAAYVMNGMYLPALVYVLQQADIEESSYSSYRWYRSLNARLQECGCEQLGKSQADRLADAQRLLEEPFMGALVLLSGDVQ